MADRTKLNTNFDDVVAFHTKFGVGSETERPHLLAVDLFEFRAKFLLEELHEFLDAHRERDLVKSFDALIDLVYVALGTADLMSLPWESGWDIVQRANLAKRRAASLDESLRETGRGHAFDVVKPEGWVSPEGYLRDLIETEEER